VRIRNIGLSRVPIEKRGTALLIYPAHLPEEGPSFPSQVQRNEPVAAFDVFAGQPWVEPSEPTSESFMVTLPHKDRTIYKVALKVASGRVWWTAETVVEDT
jgi:hypothetical protein